MGMTIQEIDDFMTHIMTRAKDDPWWIAYDEAYEKYLKGIAERLDKELFENNKRVWLQNRLDGTPFNAS